MSLVVSPEQHPEQHPAPPAGVAAAAGPSIKWLWAAVGVLGVSVVALGTTLAVQSRAPQSGASAPAELAVASAPPRGAAVEPNPSAAPAAQSNLPRGLGAVRAAAAPSASPVNAAPQPAAHPQPVRTAAPAPVCTVCGRVESVDAVQQGAPATGVGAVAGGVLGAVVGNQIGKGSGRTAATVLGAVGGGYVGHKVEERTRTQTVYQIAVRMEDGSVRRFTRAQPTAVGTPVVLQGKGFRVDDGAPARAPEPYGAAQGPAQPGTVRVAGTY